MNKQQRTRAAHRKAKMPRRPMTPTQVRRANYHKDTNETVRKIFGVPVIYESPPDC